jgi:hypothetical protein
LLLAFAALAEQVDLVPRQGQQVGLEQQAQAQPVALLEQPVALVVAQELLELLQKLMELLSRLP